MSTAERESKNTELKQNKCEGRFVHSTPKIEPRISVVGRCVPNHYTKKVSLITLIGVPPHTGNPCSYLQTIR